jgi:hypothetical protein
VTGGSAAGVGVALGALLAVAAVLVGVTLLAMGGTLTFGLQ